MNIILRNFGSNNFFGQPFWKITALERVIVDSLLDLEIKKNEILKLKCPECPKCPNSGGGNLVVVLGRQRKVTKVGRKSMITYKGKQISLTEARALEKKQQKEKKKPNKKTVTPKKK